MSTARKTSAKKASSPPKTPLTPASAAFERMERKLEEQKEAIIEQLTAVMRKSEERVMERISELAAETANLKLSIAAIDKRVTAVESTCNEVLNLRSELVAAQAQLSALESSAVSTDLIINGIPHAAGECLPELFTKICRATDHKPPPLRDAFRLKSLKSNGRSDNCPFVVKLFSSYDRNQLCKSIAVFRKSKKRSLALSDIELPGYGSISIHESLPKKLLNVMSYAADLRRKKQLSSAFSIRGKIFVRLTHNEEPKLVSSTAEINALIARTRK